MDEVHVNLPNGVQNVLGNEQFHVKGLSIFTTAVFIAGEMAGSGILALPKAVANAGQSRAEH